jgi:cell division protein FtsB
MIFAFLSIPTLIILGFLALLIAAVVTTAAILGSRMRQSAAKHRFDDAVELRHDIAALRDEVEELRKEVAQLRKGPSVAGSSDIKEE